MVSGAERSPKALPEPIESKELLPSIHAQFPRLAPAQEPRPRLLYALESPEIDAGQDPVVSHVKPLHLHQGMVSEELPERGEDVVGLPVVVEELEACDGRLERERVGDGLEVVFGVLVGGWCEAGSSRDPDVEYEGFEGGTGDEEGEDSCWKGGEAEGEMAEVGRYEGEGNDDGVEDRKGGKTGSVYVSYVADRQGFESVAGRGEEGGDEVRRKSRAGVETGGAGTLQGSEVDAERTKMKRRCDGIAVPRGSR